MGDFLNQLLDGYAPNRRRVVGGVAGAGSEYEDAAAAPAAAAGDPALLAEAGLHITLGRLADAIDRATAPKPALDDPYAIARFIPITALFTVNADATGLVDLGGPTAGYLWTVRRVSVCNAQSFTTAVPGLGQFYTAIATEAETVRPQLVAWSFPTLPNVALFGSDQFPVKYGEHVTFAMTGGTPGQQLLATVMVQLYSGTSRQPSVDII